MSILADIPVVLLVSHRYYTAGVPGQKGGTAYMADVTDRPRKVEGIGWQCCKSAVDCGRETAEVRCQGMVNTAVSQSGMLACDRVNCASSRVRGGRGIEAREARTACSRLRLKRVSASTWNWTAWPGKAHCEHGSSHDRESTGTCCPLGRGRRAYHVGSQTRRSKHTKTLDRRPIPAYNGRQ